MKRFFVAILALICLFSFVGCSQNDISKYITKKDGEQYLILPISKKEISVWDEEEAKYLKYIDVDLLKKAEKKISADAAQHEEDPHFYLDFEDGYLCLCAEVIVDLEEPDKNGMDHKHVFFKEKITKKPVQKNK